MELDFVEDLFRGLIWSSLLKECNLNPEKVCKDVKKWLKRNKKEKYEIFKESDEKLVDNVGEPETEITNHNLGLFFELFSTDYRNIHIENVLTMDYLSRDYDFFTKDAFNNETCLLNEKSKLSFIRTKEENNANGSRISSKMAQLKSRVDKFLNCTGKRSKSDVDRFLCFPILSKGHYWIYIINFDKKTLHVMNSMAEFNRYLPSENLPLSTKQQKFYDTTENFTALFHDNSCNNNKKDFGFSKSLGYSLMDTLEIAKEYYKLKHRDNVSFESQDNCLLWYFKTHFDIDLELHNDFLDKPLIQENSTDCGVFCLLFFFLQFVVGAVSQEESLDENIKHVKHKQIDFVTSGKLESNTIVQNVKQNHVNDFRRFLASIFAFYMQ